MSRIINNRKFRLLLACISLLVLVDLVQDTYAKYVSSADASSNFTIARWNFTVNSQDVIANNDFSNTIIPTFDQNPNISSGVIAPTSTGHFDVVINSSNVDVAFDEVITLSLSDSNTVSDLEFIGYSLNSSNEIIEFDGTTSITNHHQLNEQNNVNTYHFYIEWVDGNGETMNNASDTAATVDGVAAIDVNISFIQNANPSQPSQSSEPEPDPGESSEPSQDPGE